MPRRGGNAKTDFHSDNYNKDTKTNGHIYTN